MPVFAKCDREGCAFAFDDADSNDEAVTKLASHYRAEHSSKGFYPDRHKERIEVYNLTCDEAVALYAGKNWRDKLANGQIDSRSITRACRHVCAYPRQYRDEVIQEVMALSAEHGQVIADPYAAADADAELFIAPAADVNPW